MTELETIRTKLVALLKAQQPNLKVVHDLPENFEVAGTIETMQGKKKVDGHYFASVIPKPKDIRLYFFPAYTHVDQLGELPPTLKKCLKGKSCFHIKKIDDELEGQIADMISKGIKLYKADKLI